MLSASTPPSKVEGFFARCQVKQSRALAEVEAELNSFLRYMPFGVFTYAQLRREIRRCAELGTPWPFVLAVIPPSATRRKSSTFRVPFTSKGILSWCGFAAPSRLP